MASKIREEIKFGTDGWRGVISDNFTFKNVSLVGQAISEWIKKDLKPIAGQKRVAIGDPIVIDVPYRKLDDDKVVSRAMDDKAGAFIVAEVMRELSKKKLNVSVVGVATVEMITTLSGVVFV